MSLSIAFATTKTAGSAGSGTPLTTATFDSTGYTHVVAFFKHEDATVTLTPSDNKSSTGWASLTYTQHSGATTNGQLFWVKIGSPGTGHTVTITPSATVGFVCVGVWLINATGGNIELDAQANAPGTSAAADGGTLSTTGVSVVSVMGMCEYNGTTWTVSSGWTRDFQTGTNSDAGGAHRGPETTSPIDPSATCSNMDWVIVSASFREPASGGTGVLAQTLAAVTLASAGTLPIQGVTAKTLAALALASAGTLPIVGASAPTLGLVTLSSASAVALQAALAQTLGALTLASAGGAPAILGVLAQTLGAATLSSAGTLPLNGTLAQTLGALALTSASVVPLNAQLAKTLDVLVLAAAGALPLSAALAQTLGGLALSSAGTSSSGITGAAGVTLGDATLSAQATVKIVGQLSAILSLLSLHSVPPQTGRLILRLILRGILRNVTRFS